MRTPVSSASCCTDCRLKIDTGRQSVMARWDCISVSVCFGSISARSISIKAGSSIARLSPSGVSTSTTNSVRLARRGFAPLLSASTQIDRPRRFVGVTKARTILEKLSLLASCEIRKSLGTRRTSESEDAIAINSRITCKCFVQLFAAHAFDRITPKALDLSDDAHEYDFAVGDLRLSVQLQLAKYDAVVCEPWVVGFGKRCEDARTPRHYVQNEFFRAASECARVLASLSTAIDH